jgi:multiple sugar transport system permease protein
LIQRKPTIAFLMALPLFTLIVVPVAYPAAYAIFLSGSTRA